MIIKELNLTSFGKFNNKKINFKKGINLIYGLNESGKSTIHTFVEGMIFGFYKPHSSMRLINENYDKYYPRNQNNFFGTMTLEFNGEELRVERNFDRDRPSLKIFNNVTGEDISNSIPQNSGTKLPDLAAYLNLNLTLYNDTISISQMSNETSKDLSNVISEKLANLSSSKTETISIPSVISKLNDKKGEIGTQAAKTKPYYLQTKRLSDLNVELQNSTLKYKGLVNFQQEIKNLNKEKVLLDNKLDILYKQRSIYNNENLKETYNIVKDLIDKKDLLVDEANKLYHLKDIKESDYNDALIINNNITRLKKEVREQNETNNKLIKEYSHLENILSKDDYLNSIDIDTLDIDTKYYNYVKDKLKKENLEEQLNSQIGTSAIPDLYESLHEDYEIFNVLNNVDYKEQLNRLNYELLNERQRLENFEDKLPNPSLKIVYYFLIPLIIGIFLLIIHNKKTKEINEKITSQNNKVLKLQKDIENICESEQMVSLSNQEIFDKYKVSSKDEFRALFLSNRPAGLSGDQINNIKTNIATLKDNIKTSEDELSEIFNNIINTKLINENTFTQTKKYINDYRDSLIKLKNYKDRLLEHQIALENTTKDLELENYKLSLILQTNNVINIENFKETLEQKKHYDKLLVSIESLNSRIKDHLKDETFEQLENSINFEIKEEFDKELYEKLLSMEPKLKEGIAPLIERMSKLNEMVNMVELEYREPSVIENDISLTSEVIDNYNLEVNAIDLVIKVLTEISDSIRFEFAPALNEEISNIIKNITSNKYDDVKVDKDMNIKVHETSTNKSVDIKGFSMGTIDQLYLAVRLGINKTISNNIHPLVLDDPFVNYDDERLKNVLKSLTKQSNDENRQVLLFTCHSREKEILDELEVSYKANNL